MKYTTKHLADLFHTSQETIRAWSAEFERYLSPTATPSTGRHRRYADDDLKVLALVAALKSEGLLFEDIHAALSAGQRLEPPDTSTDLQTTPQTGIIERLQTERESLLAQLTEAQNNAAQLRGQLQQLNQHSSDLERRLDTAQAEITRLNRENAILSYRLEQDDD